MASLDNALVLALMMTRRLFGVLFRKLGVPGENESWGIRAD